MYEYVYHLSNLYQLVFFDKSLSLQTAVLENWFQLLSRNSLQHTPNLWLGWFHHSTRGAF